MGKTLYEKIWDIHICAQKDEKTSILYIDQHLLHEITSPIAFDTVVRKGLSIHRPESILAVADHNISTLSSRSDESTDPEATLQLKLIRENTKLHNIEYYGYEDSRQGIVHVVGPEQGITQPGMTIVCGDSHTSTHGAFGALAFGICTTEIEHVLATQTLLQQKSKTMEIRVDGELPKCVTAKDLILAIIGKIGTSGATGHVIEFTGPAILKLSMEERMTICNMAIELGARSGIVAPDQITFDYLKGRPQAPLAEYWDIAVEYWKQFHTDLDAKYDSVVIIKADQIQPMVTWGTSPEDVLCVNSLIPSPEDYEIGSKRLHVEDALAYMGLTAGQKITDIMLDKIFIGSCTNSRIEDLRQASKVVNGKKIAVGVSAIVVPGSGLVKKQAEAEGLDIIFKQAGFEWREAGCSMCLGMNADRLKPGERCASTSNRNFKGRQGPNGRTHLVSPTMAAAAAIAGHFVDIRTWESN